MSAETFHAGAAWDSAVRFALDEKDIRKTERDCVQDSEKDKEKHSLAAHSAKLLRPIPISTTGRLEFSINFRKLLHV